MLMTLPVTTKAQAEVKDNLPQKARIFTYDTPSSSSVKLTLKDPKKTIENVKSGSSKLKVGLVGDRTVIQQGNVTDHSFTIGMVAFEDGTYTVTYDIVKDKKVIATNKIKVYAYPSPIKSITLDGKKVSFYGTKTKAKIKVSLVSGNTIKKLEVGTQKTKKDTKNTEVVYKTFKNGDAVKLGTIASYIQYGWGDRLKDDFFGGNMYTSSMSDTHIRITYKDKYTKQDEVKTLSLFGIAK